MSIAEKKLAVKRRAKATAAEGCATVTSAKEAELDENRRVARMLVQRHHDAMKRLAKR